MRISDWSSDVCSSDLQAGFPAFRDDDDETYQSLSSHRAPAKAGAQGQNLNGRYSSNRIVRGSGSRIKSFHDDFSGMIIPPACTLWPLGAVLRARLSTLIDTLGVAHAAKHEAAPARTFAQPPDQQPDHRNIGNAPREAK